VKIIIFIQDHCVFNLFYFHYNAIAFALICTSVLRSDLLLSNFKERNEEYTKEATITVNNIIFTASDPSLFLKFPGGARNISESAKMHKIDKDCHLKNF
jgi:hypothetical protein